jgi:SAM-dependent methyltransferase
MTPGEHYTREYFERWNYADRPLGASSMYGFARRYYAGLVRRFSPPPSAGRRRRLLEIGCGLGHLLGLLQHDFECLGIDRIDFAVEQTRLNAPAAEARPMDADDLSAFDDEAFDAVVALHVVEHLENPGQAVHQVARILRPAGLFLFATPNPDYALRRFKDPATDAIGKDPTHIHVHPPAVWRRWCADEGLDIRRHFGDGLWDVPYVPWIPNPVQFAVFGLPALLQVATRTTFTPVALGVNQVVVARKPRPSARS